MDSIKTNLFFNNYKYVTRLLRFLDKLEAVDRNGIENRLIFDAAGRRNSNYYILLKAKFNLQE